MITPLPGITDTKPCYASYPLPGIQPVLVDTEGNLVEGNDVEGLLCIKFPWPSIIRTTYGDHERCRQVYFSSFDNMYFTGDGCRRDAEGRCELLDEWMMSSMFLVIEWERQRSKMRLTNILL